MGLKVRGYAAVFGNKDHAGEVIDRGAFTDWIAANPDTSVPIFWQHKHKWDIEAKPIGATTTLKQDRKGLYFEGEILDTAEGLEVQALLQGGAVKNMSFGYNTTDRYQKKDTWHLSKLEVMELSPANWGANPKAYIEVVPDQETNE